MTKTELLAVIKTAVNTNATKLNLNSQSITELPHEIGQLKNLTMLHLYNNELTSLPPEIGALERLRIYGFRA